VRTEEGKLYVFVGIERTSKFGYAELVERAGKLEAAQFLRNLIAAVPSRSQIVLTDNGIQVTNRLRDRYALDHIFARVCREHAIEQRLTKPKHPWTNGQVERMNRTLKEATVKRSYYETHHQLKEHLYNFLTAYNVAKRLKRLQGLTSYEDIMKCWQSEPERFHVNLAHHIVGLNT
jgi:transposase InsO family protein